MNTQRAYTQEMEEAFASIQLEDEEQEGLNYENNVEDLTEIDTGWCLVGRFLTDSSISRPCNTKWLLFGGLGKGFMSNS